MRDSDRIEKVIEQYQTTDALNVRMRLHALYTVAEEPFYQWVFDRIPLYPGARVLECGCGDGALWKSNIRRVPDGARVTLTDLSEGMLKSAKGALGEAFAYQVADITALPFADGAFDAVIANHMLYHVKDIDRALSEVRRVLARGGALIASTCGGENFRELWELSLSIDPAFSAPKLSFTLENGKAILERHFSSVEIHAHASHLFVTSAQDIIDYIASMASFDVMQADKLDALKRLLEAQIREQGGIQIHKSAGLFQCK